MRHLTLAAAVTGRLFSAFQFSAHELKILQLFAVVFGVQTKDTQVRSEAARLADRPCGWEGEEEKEAALGSPAFHCLIAAERLNRLKRTAAASPSNAGKVSGSQIH